ncbi:MAG: hypothetical protein ABIT37_06975 [Luteolibacter sp.]
MKALFISLTLVLLFTGCQEKEVKQQKSAEQLVAVSKYWDYAYSCGFSDGGSIAYGFINEEGEILYLFAYSPMISPEKRKIALTRSYNAPRVEIVFGSNLEAEVLKVVENANEYSWMEGHLPKLDGLKAMLRDRSTPFPKTDIPSEEDAASEQSAAHPESK